jgi:hypothetical protein
MTNEIKSAREAVEYCLSQIQTDHTKPKDNHIWTTGTTARPTISEETLQLCLKALSVYEKLQGVDFDELIRVTDTVCSSRILHGARAYYLPEDIETLENAARIIADIGKDR